MKNTTIEDLLELLAYHKGTIVSTASLHSHDILQAQKSGRMYVDEKSALGFVWLPAFANRFAETEEEVEQFDKWYPLDIFPDPLGSPYFLPKP